MLSEIFPDTPVSISSKIIVGNFLNRDNKVLIANIIRESSPPEATFFKILKSWPLFALNSNDKISEPLKRKSSLVDNSILKFACSIPILETSLFNSFSKTEITFFLFSESLKHCSFKEIFLFLISCSIEFNLSSRFIEF